MSKILEKALKDGIKGQKCTIGSRQVLAKAESSKLIVVSQSVTNAAMQAVRAAAEKAKVPTVRFEGTSVALGKLCGLQFRASMVSFDAIAESNITSIVKESEDQ